APGVPVVRVVNLVDLEVSADVSEKYVGVFNSGDQVSVYFPALRDTVKAKISSVGQVINPNNRTFTLRVSLPSNDSRYKPTLLAIIHATDFASNKAISVPSNLVQTEGYRKYIYVAVKDGDQYRAEKRDISTGLTSQGKILVESGLQAGDIVISEGYLSIESGDIVKP